MSIVDHDRPITVAILALGGQGGGVLTGWLVELAEANGYLAQSTYVAGVAQRTGATVYCVEMFPRNKALEHEQPPVFTLYPIPGDVDLVVASEMAEMGRAIQKGFVTPNATTLIASSHRVYTISEKEALDDGIQDQSPVADVAKNAAKNFVCFDMQAAADESNSIISAVMLGAIAAVDALPFDRDAYLDVIRESGRSVDQNLAGFAAGFAGASKPAESASKTEMPLAKPQGSNGEQLVRRINEELPSESRDIALHGALRVLDYQDAAYANAYIDTLVQFYNDENSATGAARDFALTTEVARQLALQMCYEDTLRVAELKTRGERMTRVRNQLGALDNQPVHVVEYFHPRIEEVCDTLPAGLGRYVLQSPRLLKLIAPMFAKGRNIKTSTITGYLMLRTIAKMKRWRRGTYRFSVQQDLISGWLNSVRSSLESNYDAALHVAQSIESVKGYGDTYQRGLERYMDAIQ